MARRLRFKPPLRQTMLANAANLALMAGGTLPADLQASMDRTLPNAPKPRAAPRKLEAPVVAAISQLLARHPRVIWAARFNSGAAGEHGHIWFHKFLRMPEPMRMPDFFGLQSERSAALGPDDNWLHFGRCRPIAIEAKAPGWAKPRDQREHEQAAFLEMIRNAGGIGIFATDAQQVVDALK